MLEHEGIYNDISPKLRKRLTDHVESLGKTVRYKFNLARKNPDPAKYNGDIIYPALWNLNPIQWKITDKEEDRLNKQLVKNVGVIDTVEINEKTGQPMYRFKRIRIDANEKGIKEFNLENPDDLDMVASLELHPKNGNGLFTDKNSVSIFSRIDEAKLASDKRAERSARKKAMDIAENMNDIEVIEFADAMATEDWNSSQDMLLLRNKLEELAETSPDMFNDKVADKKMAIQASIKRAIDNRILSYNPAEGSLSWMNTGQNIVTLGMGAGDRHDVERFAEWFDSGGKKQEETFKKIKSLNSKPAVTV